MQVDPGTRYSIEELYQAVFSQDPKITFELRQAYRLRREQEDEKRVK